VYSGLSRHLHEVIATGTHLSQGWVAALTIIEYLKVVKDYLFVFLATAKHEFIVTFCLTVTKETLHYCVVISIALISRAEDQPIGTE
jgi:hypothetical protein